MSASFPTSLPAAGSASSSATLAAAGHTALHNNGADETRAVATKVGTGSSTPTAGNVLRANGTGTSVWGPVDLAAEVSGLLPTSHGGTGTTSVTGTGSVVYDTAPTMSNPTITGGGLWSGGPVIGAPSMLGGGSWAGGPTIVAPVIASFASANHNHSNSAGGGLPVVPYKFNVYRNAALTISTGVFQLIPLDAMEFDTSSNVDIVTNKGRFTAPVAGFYQISWHVGNSIAATDSTSALYKGGAIYRWGAEMTNGGGSGGSALIQLAAADYLELFAAANTNGVINVGINPIKTWMSGFLVSTT